MEDFDTQVKERYFHVLVQLTSDINEVVFCNMLTPTGQAERGLLSQPPEAILTLQTPSMVTTKNYDSSAGKYNVEQLRCL